MCFTFLEILEVFYVAVLPVRSPVRNHGLEGQAPRPFVTQTEGKMGYEDFVWFILSEEDKTNDVSLEYWFKCVDLDCDSSLRANEMLVGPPSLDAYVVMLQHSCLRTYAFADTRMPMLAHLHLCFYCT